MLLGVVLCSAAAVNATAAPLLEQASARAALEQLASAPDAADAEARWVILEPALDALPPAEARALLGRLAAQRRAPALAMRARLAGTRYAADLAEVRDTARALGFVERWLAAGPVPMVPREILDAHLELRRGTPPALGEALGEARWDVLERAGPPGAVSVDHLLPDDAPSAVHLVARFRLERASEVYVRLGGAGQLAASVDGELLGAVHSLAFAAPDQLVASLRLQPGDHLLAVSAAREAGGRAMVYARLTDRSGRPLPVSWGLPDAGSSQVWAPLEGDALGLDWARCTHARRRDLSGRVLAAAARRALGVPDPEAGEDGEGELLEELLLEPGVAALGTSDLLLALGQVRREEARASVLLQSAAGGGTDAAARLTLAELAASRGQLTRARSLLAASDGAPAELRAVVAGRVARRAGLPAEAWRPLHEQADSAPTARLLAERANVAQAMGRPDLALEPLTTLHSVAPGELEHAAGLAQVLTDLGREDEALGLLDALRERRPDVLGYPLQAARQRLARGEVERARATAASVAAAAGVDASAVAAAAQLIEDSGDAAAAAELWRRALALRPGDPDLRAAVTRTEPRSDERLPFELDLARDLQPLEPVGEGGLFEVLGEELHVEVQADGGYVRYQARVLRVLRVPDERDARTFSVAFDPSQEQVRVLSARVHRGGLAIPVTARETQQISESWYGMYYDMRALSVPFDDLRPGDLVEIRHRVDAAASEAMPGTFSLLEPLSERMPKRRVVLSVTAPRALGLRVRLGAPGGPGGLAGAIEQAQTELPDGRVRYVARVRDLRALPSERGMPAAAEQGLVWQVSSFTSWEDLAHRYRQLIAPQRVVTPAMRRWVEARVAEATSVEGGLSRPRLLRALVDGLTAEIRYVGLEFGVHGFQPYRTDQVWARRFGDCKDQATLMSTMLQLAGIDADVVLVRTRPRGLVGDALPSLALFDHAIVHLTDDARFVDPTARWVGLGELPEGDQGAQALVLAADTASASPVRIPPDPPARNGLEGFFTVVLAEDGSGRVEGESTFRGVQAATYRAQLADADAREERLTRMMNGRYPGFELVSHEVSDPLDRSSPLRFTFVGDVPRVAEPIGDTLQVPRPAGGDGHAARLAGDTTRRSALLLGAPVTLRTRFRYVLPVGFGAADIPASREEEGAFGSWSVQWAAEPGEVRAASELVLAVDRVEAGEYPAFRAFMQRFDEAVRPPLVLRRDAPETAELRP